MSRSENLLRPNAQTHVPPRNELECRLAAIWERVLTAQSVGVTDNFFESGGDSFQALRLAEEIERSFARTLPLGVIFSLPTIEKLAGFLDSEEGLSTGFSLVPLQTGGVGRPIFVVHWTLRDLVRHLGTDRPVYALSFGLAAQTTHQQLALPERLENLAAHYVEEMRVVQPRGPYSMIGYSGGGLVAFEMAQQLLVQGETVSFLGLIDTSVARDYFTVSRFPLHRQILNVFRLPPREISESLTRNCWRPLSQKLHSMNSRGVRNHLEDQWLDESALNFWMSYVPRPYPGKLTLFKANGLRSVRYQRIPPERAWIELTAGRLDIYEVPGRHCSVVAGPNAHVLATKLRACLD